jgi:hypothetical protein
MKPIKLIAIALLSFFANSANAQVRDSLPMIEVDTTEAIYDAPPPPMIEYMDGDYGDYSEMAVEAEPATMDAPMTFFNEFNTKTFAKLELNPDKPARYLNGFGEMNTELQESLSLPYNYSTRAKYVIIQVTVGKDSMLYNPKVIHTEGTEYTRNAKDAIQSLSGRFVPAMKAGKPVDSTLLIPIRFETATKRTNTH